MSESKKNDILIIEDSPSTTHLLTEFLNNLGYQNIHSCETGQSGIDVFKELVRSNKIPIVFLDYQLPDMNALAVMTQIIIEFSGTKVILETAAERSDEGVKEVIRLGAYQYLEKPIRYESLKNIIQILEQESSFLEKESKMVEILKKTEEKLQQQIDYLLRSSTRISIERLSQYTGSKQEQILPYLKKLESEGRIISLADLKEISCSMCDSVKVTPIFSCPSCNSSNFKHGKLIEHFKCGNVSIENTYTNNTCPKCHKEIRTIGVDYKIMDNYYICNDCENKFAELSQKFLCLKCNNAFDLNQGKWITSSSYKAMKL